MVQFSRLVGGMSMLAALTACGAVAKSSGPMALGPDTYRVAVRAPLGDVTDSQRMALSEAQAHCKSMSKELMTIGTRRLDQPSGGPYEVTFRCLTSGDPDLQRPNLQSAPSAVIQVK